MSVSVGQAKPKKSLPDKVIRHLKRHWQLHVLALPALAYMIIFNYFPMFGLVMAFQDFKVSTGFFHSKFVGLKNFEFLFQSNNIWQITRNTILYNVAFIILNMVFSVLLAMVFNEIYVRGYSKVLQTLLIMPNFLSITVVALIVYAFLAQQGGVLNQLLRAMGQSGKNWYAYVPIWPPLIVVGYLWKNVGYSSIVYVASLSGIPQEHYEAALLDGATKTQQARYITLPYLRTIITIQMILNLGGLIRGDIGWFQQVTMDSPTLYPVTDVIDTYVYRALKSMANPGMNAAVGMYQSAVGFVLVIIANAIVRKVDEDSALF